MVALDSDFGLCRTSVWDLHLGRFDFPDFQDLQVQFPERPPMRYWTYSAGLGSLDCGLQGGLDSDSKLVLDLRGVAGRHLPGFGPPPEADRAWT